MPQLPEWVIVIYSAQLTRSPKSAWLILASDNNVHITAPGRMYICRSTGQSGNYGGLNRRDMGVKTHGMPLTTNPIGLTVLRVMLPPYNKNT